MQIRRSWADKERLKAKLNATKLREAEMKAAVAEEQTAKKMRQKEARERREANAQKNDVVQVIKDPTKIKKMSRRQLKYIRKAALL
jgi:rRNA-processing protein CGR1